MKAEIAEKYRHYKGNEYLVIHIARNSENIDDEFVIYQDMSDSSKVWARPRPMFEEDIEIDGKVMPRFTKIS